MPDQSSEKDLRLAVLIDADNASRTAMKDVMAEVAVYGTPTIKRIYGDWTTPNLASWKPLLLENAITPVQQYGYTTGKNSTDSAMIIDAMDILYTGQVDGFVLVSSDSDFTRLAIRLREAGKKVYGMGEKKTPNPFIVACDKFVYIEVIRSAAQQERAEEAAREEPKEPPKPARRAARKKGAEAAPPPAPEAEPPSRVPKEIITLLADSVEMLADLLHQKKQKTLKQLQRYIRKSWLTAWLDEKNEKLYLTVEDYRAAQEEQKAAAAAASKAETQPKQDADAVPLNLEVARSFTEVLKKEKTLMQDERAVEELDRMQKTTQAICDWLEAHPESLPKARRFAEYYIPTTLKLLHTYNDVQGQQGENAEAIRRDIAGILHTLNQAYDNLYDKLLSDVALDVSSEIAALQGMLANDGLTGEGML